MAGSFWPSAGKSPTGIFSTRGSQKRDSTSRFGHKELMSYAKGSSTRSTPKSKGRAAKRMHGNGGKH